MEEWEARDETSFWLNEGTSRDTVAQTRAEIKDGQSLAQKQIRAEFGRPDPSD